VSFSQSMNNGSILMQSSSVTRMSSINVHTSSRSPMADALCDAARSPFVNLSSSSKKQSNTVNETPSSSRNRVFAPPQRSESPMRTPSKSSVDHINMRGSPWKMLGRKEFRESVLDNDYEDDELTALKEKSIDVAIAKHTRKTSQSISDMDRPTLAGPPPLVTSQSEPIVSPKSPSSRRQPMIHGSPPPEFQEDFDDVMRHLEEIWNCELESFETVGRLAQCLVLREQTWQRLSRLKMQETTMVAPDQDDLYDIEL